MVAILLCFCGSNIELRMEGGKDSKWAETGHSERKEAFLTGKCNCGLIWKVCNYKTEEWQKVLKTVNKRGKPINVSRKAL